jgi:type IV secretory pathway component VirB8
MSKNRIEESVEDGSYFKEALHWYNDVFLYPMRSNAFMMGAGISISVVFLFVLYSLWNVFPLSEQVGIIVRVPNTLSKQVKLENIDESGENTEKSIMEYLVTKYINAREVYEPNRYKSNYYFILRSTEKNIFNSYYEAMSQKDESHPAALYKNGERSKIDVISTSYDPNAKIIAVKYNKQNYNIYTNARSSEAFEAKVNFYVSDYDFKESKDANLSFIVTNYEVEKVQN